MKNLYCLTTHGFDYFYVIANDPTEAEESLTKILNGSDYGFKNDRLIVKIELMAKEIYPFGEKNGKPQAHLSGTHNKLLIADDWK